MAIQLQEKTIRSKFLIEPGDYLNDYLLNNSINNLRKFSYIKEIKHNVKYLDNDVANISFTIDEQKKTGNLLFAGTLTQIHNLALHLG